MSSRELNQRFVEAVRTQAERIEIRDARTEGLELRVTRFGTKTWLLRYRRRADGKKRVLTLGRFPELGLKEARLRAIEVRGEVAKGGDPASQSTSKPSMTFAVLAEKRLREDVDITEGTRRAYQQCFVADVLPAFGDVDATAVTPEMVARLLDKIENRGSPVQADRTKAAIGSTFKWAIKRRHAGVLTDPCAGLGKRAPSTARSRLLSEEELGKFWLALHDEDAPLSPQMRLICQLAVLTGQRRTEVAGARVQELRLDCTAPIWIIPGDNKRKGILVRGRTKNRKEQVVPLSSAARDRFKQAISMAGESEFVFPASTVHSARLNGPRTPHIHGDSVSMAVRRLRTDFGIDDVRLHDLRRSISTWLGENGYRPDVIELILNHQPRDITRRHYNLAGMIGLVREALEAWAAHVDAPRTRGTAAPTESPGYPLNAPSVDG